MYVCRRTLITIHTHIHDLTYIHDLTHIHDRTHMHDRTHIHDLTHIYDLTHMHNLQDAVERLSTELARAVEPLVNVSTPNRKQTICI